METGMAYCPFCGAEAEPGDMSVFGQFASLEWKARTRTPSRHPVRLFGRAFFLNRRKTIPLLRATVSAMFTGFDLSHAPKPSGWYCPNCRKVVAVFDVPPEDGGELGNREGGVE